MEFRKMVTMTLKPDRKRDTDIKNRLLDSVGYGRRQGWDDLREQH